MKKDSFLSFLKKSNCHSVKGEIRRRNANPRPMSVCRNPSVKLGIKLV